MPSFAKVDDDPDIPLTERTSTIPSDSKTFVPTDVSPLQTTLWCDLESFCDDRPVNHKRSCEYLEMKLKIVHAMVLEVFDYSVFMGYRTILMMRFRFAPLLGGGVQSGSGSGSDGSQ